MKGDGTLGFTGTRRGMTTLQKLAVESYAALYRPVDAVHGGEEHADAQFHEICRKLGIEVDVRPSDLQPLHAILPLFVDARLIYPQKPPLDRNDDIVAQATRMIAAPGEEHEVQRSGTWATIRRARKAGVPLLIVYPKGRRELS